MDSKNIKYVITSSFSKYNQARSYCLDSLVCNKINFSDIYIILSRSKDTYIKPPENDSSPTEIYLESNLFEYSFFVGCSLLLDAKLINKNDRYFMLHDTCVVGPKFRDRVKQAYLKYSKYDIIYGNNWGQHNIGLYNYKSILYGYKIYNHLDLITKQAAIAFEHRGPHPESPKCWPLKQYFPNYGSMLQGLCNPYEDNKLRELNYIYFFDLNKYFFWGGTDGAGI